MNRDRIFIVASISIGMALLACMLSSTYAVLLDPLPFPQANRIVTVSTLLEGFRISSSLPDYQDLSRECGPLKSSIYVNSLFGETALDGRPEVLRSVRFAGNMWSVFGKAPLLGDPGDLDSGRQRDTAAAILTYPAWIRFFGKDPGVLGKTVHIGSGVYEVRAVLPPEYQVVLPADLWIAVSPPQAGDRGNRDGRIYARLAPGVSVEGANAHLATVASSLQKETPASNKGVTFESRLLRDSLAGDSKQLLYLLACGAAIVLCVAYFNVYQLLAAKAVAASAQWTLRVALGASRKRLFQDMLKEPLLLSLAGCALGLLLSGISMRTLRALSPTNIPRLGDARLVWQVAAASFAVSAVAAALFAGLILRRALSYEATLMNALRGGQKSGASIRHALGARKQLVLMAQIAFSATLLISMGVVALALRQAIASPLGFAEDGVSVTDLMLKVKEPANTAAGSQYVRDVIQRISTLPGVEKVAATSSAPFKGQSYNAKFITGEEGDGRTVELQYAAISPEFFHTLRTTVLYGRTFTDSDDGNSPGVAILNQAAVQALFGSAQGLNRQLKGNLDPNGYSRRVVGVVENIRQDPTTVAAPPLVYVPLAQAKAYTISLLVRAHPTVENAAIKARIWTINSNQAVSATAQLADLIDSSLRRIRYMALLMALFAAVTMLLSALGIYAAVAHWLSTSQKEIAVCLALGATYSKIRRGVLAKIMAIAGVAFALGSMGALAAGNALQSLLYGVRPQMGAAFAGALLLLGGAALFSSYIPALRSKFIDPAQLLRYE